MCIQSLFYCVPLLAQPCGSEPFPSVLKPGDQYGQSVYSLASTVVICFMKDNMPSLLNPAQVSYEFYHFLAIFYVLPAFRQITT